MCLQYKLALHASRTTTYKPCTNAPCCVQQTHIAGLSTYMQNTLHMFVCTMLQGKTHSTRSVACLQKLINQPEYKKLNSTEKLALLEHGVCPQTPLPGCHEMSLNFVVDWQLLEEAMKVAFANLRSRHSTVLDGTDPYHK